MAESEDGLRTRTGSTRVIILVLGVVYLVFAVAGMVTVGWHEFKWEEPVRLFGIFGVSTLLNIAHGFLGLVALAAAIGGAAFAFAPVLAVVFTGMTAFGIVASIGVGTGDPFNLTWWNVVLYLLSVAACGYAYFSQVRAVWTHDEDSPEQSPDRPQ
jgi:Domain of unknown function (DUF4383)